LDEKLHSLGKEGDRTRAELKGLQEVVYKLVGRIEELDKRVDDRFNELDKRLREIDRRVEIQIELVIRKQLEQQQTIASPRIAPKRGRDRLDT